MAWNEFTDWPVTIWFYWVFPASDLLTLLPWVIDLSQLSLLDLGMYCLLCFNICSTIIQTLCLTFLALIKSTCSPSSSRCKKRMQAFLFILRCFIFFTHYTCYPHTFFQLVRTSMLAVVSYSKRIVFYLHLLSFKIDKHFGKSLFQKKKKLIQFYTLF